MGCSCSKNVTAKNLKSRIADKRFQSKVLNEDRSIVSHINTVVVEKKNKVVPKRNMFYIIQKKTWIKILDFLPYKDLCQAGQLSKFLNKVAKSQNILIKFYKNKSSSVKKGNVKRDNSTLRIGNEQKQVTNHLTITNYNNYSSTNEPSYKSARFDKTNSEDEVRKRKHVPPLDFDRMLLRPPTLKAEHDKLSSSQLSSPNNFTSVKHSDTHSNFSNNSMKSSLKVKSKGYSPYGPYVDIFSKKEIDLRAEVNQRSEANDSIEHFNFIPSRKISVSGEGFDKSHKSDKSDKSPSFSQDYLCSLQEEGVEMISITNITQYKIPSNKKSRSKERYLKMPFHNKQARVSSAGQQNSNNVLHKLSM